MKNIDKTRTVRATEKDRHRDIAQDFFRLQRIVRQNVYLICRRAISI